MPGIARLDSDPDHPTSMTRLTIDDVREALPDLDDLRPIFDYLLARSHPDRARLWSGSGRLDTVGTRVVPHESVTEDLREVATVEARRLSEVFEALGHAIEALGAQDRAAAARALLDAAALEESRDRPDRAEAYAAAAYHTARGERDQGPATLALRRWARAARARGHLDDAYQRYTRAHGAARAMGDGRGAAEAAIGAGNVLEERGRWTEAGACYRAALAALDGIVEPVPERWHALLNLHIVTRSSGAIEQSLGLLDEAERAAAEIEPETAAPLIANARGQLEMSRADFAAAERHLRNALDGPAGSRARVTFRLNLAEALLAQGRNLDAAEQAREAEREAVRVGLVPKLPEVYRLLGRIAAADENADAFVFFERALELVRQRELPALEEALTLQAYAEFEAHRGESDTGRQLHAEAAGRFQALGMTHMRRTWADVYGPGPDENDLP